MKTSKIIVFMGVLLLMSVFLLAQNQSKTSAQLFVALTPPTGFIPPQYAGPITTCNNPANYAIGSWNFFGSWISNFGRSNDLSGVTVDAGATFVTQQINTFSVNCHDTRFTGNYYINNVHVNVTSVSSSPGGSFNNLGPGTSIFAPYNNPTPNNGPVMGNWGNGSVPFDFIPNVAFTNPGLNRYDITVRFRQAYNRSNGTVGCAENGFAPASFYDISACAEQSITRPILVNVRQPQRPPVGSIVAECNFYNANRLPVLRLRVSYSDPDGDTVSVVASNNGRGGNFWSSGTHDFEMPYDYVGTASMTIQDSTGRATGPIYSNQYTCLPDPNRPPTGQISATCTRNALGFAEVRVTIFNVSDPDGDPVTISANSGVGNSIGSQGTFGPFSAPLYVAPSFFQGSATLTVRDPKNASNSYSFTYNCPSNNPPEPFNPVNPGRPSDALTALCSTLGTLPVVRELSISMSIRDPDGGFSPVRARATGPPYGGGVIANGNGSHSSPGSFASPARDGNTYQVNFYANDAQNGVEYLVGTRTYFCYRNPISLPNDLNCAITSSGSIEPGAPLQPAVTVYNPFGLTGGITYRLTNDNTTSNVPGTPQSPGNRSPLSGSYGAGYFTPVTMPSPGRYTQGATLTMVPGVPDDPTTASCGGGVTITVNNMPYFRVLYGDIVTYTDSVRGWNRGPSGSFTGASANGMILSEDGICPSGSPLNCGVASMSGAGTGPVGSNAPRSLTFSNSGGGMFGQGYGPNTGAFSLPVDGVTEQVRQNAPKLNSSTAIPSATGVYYNDAGNTIALSGGAVSGRVTIYSNNAQGINISGNIVAVPGPYASVDNIPRVRIIASGPIYIWPSVSRIDAELISGDRIYTCHGGTGAWGAPGPINVNLFDAGCNSGLVVNGALMARNGIKLTRVQGTLRNSTISDGINNCSAPVANCNNIAELIRFMPDLYITKPQGNPTVSAELRYDAVTALSPLY